MGFLGGGVSIVRVLPLDSSYQPYWNRGPFDVNWVRPFLLLKFVGIRVYRLPLSWHVVPLFLYMSGVQTTSSMNKVDSLRSSLDSLNFFLNFFFFFRFLASVSLSDELFIPRFYDLDRVVRGIRFCFFVHFFLKNLAPPLSPNLLNHPLKVSICTDLSIMLDFREFWTTTLTDAFFRFIQAKTSPPFFFFLSPNLYTSVVLLNLDWTRSSSSLSVLRDQGWILHYQGIMNCHPLHFLFFCTRSVGEFRIFPNIVSDGVWVRIFGTCCVEFLIFNFIRFLFSSIINNLLLYLRLSLLQLQDLRKKSKSLKSSYFIIFFRSLFGLMFPEFLDFVLHLSLFCNICTCINSSWTGVLSLSSIASVKMSSKFIFLPPLDSHFCGGSSLLSEQRFPRFFIRTCLILQHLLLDCSGGSLQ